MVSRVPPKWPPVEVESPAPHPDAPEPGTKLGPHYDQCFGCGDEVERRAAPADRDRQDSTIVAQFTVTEAHQGAPGLAHGGLLACAFDEALGSTVGQLLRQPAVTGRLETDFLRPVPVGSTLHIVGKLDGIAGRKVYASADGRLERPGRAGGAAGPGAVRDRRLQPLHHARHRGPAGRAPRPDINP